MRPKVMARPLRAVAEIPREADKTEDAIRLLVAAEGAGGVTWRRWQLLLPRHRVVETALSREKKNEEISDGDKESALVNIVVTHMFCGDQSVVFQAVFQEREA